MTKKKAKKTEAPQRRSALDQIAAKLRTALRRATTNIIEIGNLLNEARKHLDRGEWEKWLAENCDRNIRTAFNYCAAAEYVERKTQSESDSDWANLAPTVLYGLAAGHYGEQEEVAILAATREGRVDTTRAGEICETLAPDDDDEDEDADDQDGGDDETEVAEDDPAIKKILDGPPPAVPPPAPIPPPTNFALRDFDAAIGTLITLMTKPSAQFAGTVYNANDLKSIEEFIRAVTKAKAATANGCTEAPR